MRCMSKKNAKSRYNVIEKVGKDIIEKIFLKHHLLEFQNRLPEVNRWDNVTANVYVHAGSQERMDET